MNMVVSHWSVSPLVLSACAAVAVVHLRGLRVVAVDARRQGRRRPAGTAGQAIAFYLGVLAVVLALVSPVGYWAQRFIWVRSVQDVLLAMAAPSLIVLGAPWLVLARGVRRGPGRALAGASAPGAGGVTPAAPAAASGAGAVADPRGRLWLTRPVVVTVAFSVAWWGWHVPALYDAALRHPGVYAAEVVSYLGLGMAFWLQLIGSGPLEPRFPPLRRVVLVIGTIVSSSVLAVGLVFGSWLLYPAYAGPAHRIFSVVADQQVGGGVLWALSLLPYFLVTVALVSRWLNEEGSEALVADLDRLLRPKTSAWPSRPGLR